VEQRVCPLGSGLTLINLKHTHTHTRAWGCVLSFRFWNSLATVLPTSAHLRLSIKGENVQDPFQSYLKLFIPLGRQLLTRHPTNVGTRGHVGVCWFVCLACLPLTADCLQLHILYCALGFSEWRFGVAYQGMQTSLFLSPHLLSSLCHSSA
jgi:hypothetical protein